MGSRRGTATAACATVILSVAGAVSLSNATVSEVVRPPATVSFSVAPKSLQQNEASPVVVRLHAALSLPASGSLPPAVRTIVAFLPKGIMMSSSRPGCSRSRVGLPSTPAVRAACRNALIGEGAARIGIEGTDKKSIRLPVLVIKGGSAKSASGPIFVRAGPSGPIDEPLIAIATTSGPRVRLVIPEIASGNGALLSFAVTLGRRQPEGPEPQLRAECSRGRFVLRVLNYVFEGGARSAGERHVSTCTNTTRIGPLPQAGRHRGDLGRPSPASSGPR